MSMNPSQESVETVLEGYARFNAGAREPSLEYWDENGEYIASSDDPDADTHQGIASVRRQYARWVEAYPDRAAALRAAGIEE